ncbi:hypothetical protein HPB52_003581 [Rhipicephalus sanguineus]|uniref:Uncharacterized protein n=1 Tax=Rhipicephalus sanguineus TaxID=34632 RepID=A0A9D4QH15_RHISA|nr:hypothetical protein HPB52_003581 [Rhipicephalus sanguineus]
MSNDQVSAYQVFVSPPPFLLTVTVQVSASRSGRQWWGNRDASHFNETIKAYCRKPSKVSYVDHEFNQLPPRRFLAADGLHSNIMGVALIAETLKGAICHGDLQAATGWPSQPTTLQVRSQQDNLHGINTTSQQHIPGALNAPEIKAEFPTIAEYVTPGRSMQAVVIDSSTTPLRKVRPAEQQSRVPLLRTPTQELPTNPDIRHSTLAKSLAPRYSLQRRWPVGHTYNMRTPAMPLPCPKED